MAKQKTFQVVIEQDEDGLFVASVPGLPGCHTQGGTMAEVKENIKEAIEGYLESAHKHDGAVFTKFVKMEPVTVAVE